MAGQQTSRVTARIPPAWFFIQTRSINDPITNIEVTAVPGPIIGAGLPGLIFAGGGLLFFGCAGSDTLKPLPEFAPDFALRAAVL